MTSKIQLKESVSKIITISFSNEDVDRLVEIADSLAFTMSQAVVCLVKIGLDNMDNGFKTQEKYEDRDRLLALVSDIFDLTRTPIGMWNMDELDLIDQNISERIMAELNYDPEATA